MANMTKNLLQSPVFIALVANVIDSHHFVAAMCMAEIDELSEWEDMYSEDDAAEEAMQIEAVLVALYDLRKKCDEN